MKTEIDTNNWHNLRFLPTTLDVKGYKIHESCVRAYHILDIVEQMVNRGDSSTTVNEFIKWSKLIPGSDKVIP